MDKNREFFHVSGSLSKDSPSYIERPADKELLNNLNGNEVCLVVAPRQTGKTSLMNHAIEGLAAIGIKTGIVDLQPMGNYKQEEEWFGGLIYQLERSLKLQIDTLEWWETHSRIGLNQRFITFIEDVVLAEIKDRVVIFFDEIDSVMNLEFSDDFFTTIRAIVNAQANNDTLKRVNFVLMGMVSPSDFIRNRSRTPFNIGKQIRLDDFDKNLLEPFKKVLGDTSEGIIDRIFYWTDGQPFMVQRFAEYVYSMPESERKSGHVDEIVKDSYLDMKIERDTHLKYIRDYLLENKKKRRKTLKTYGSVLQGKEITYTEKLPVHSRLLLSGVIKVRDEKLVPRNRIYQGVFNGQWVKENTPRDVKKMVAYSTSSVLVCVLLWFFIIQPLLFPEFIQSQRYLWFSEDIYYTDGSEKSIDLSFPSKNIKRITKNHKSVSFNNDGNDKIGNKRFIFNDLKVGENIYLIRWFEGIFKKNYETKIVIVYHPVKYWKELDDLEMVAIPAGCFEMGSDIKEKGRNKDEKLHEVCLSEFEIGKYEITQGQWQKIMGYNPSYFKEGDRYPVEQVSWDQIQEFLRRYNSLSEKSYRLPTEAEWEYACRAGASTPFSTGENLTTEQANYNGVKTMPVGSYPPNTWGLCDMHGNVWEWCQDWYERGYYLKSPKDNPQGPSGGSNRVLRGGSWILNARPCRSAFRLRIMPDDRNSLTGFRLVLPRSAVKAGR